MGLTVKNKKIEPLNLLIDFFAWQYDMVYNFLTFLAKPILALKGEKSIMDILIDFFASLYDAVFGFIIFLIEYVKWITNINVKNSKDFSATAEKPIQIPFDAR